MLSRLGAMINPFDEESKQRRAARKERRAAEQARTEEFGFPWAKTPIEQADMAQQAAENAAPQTGPPTANAGAKADIARTVAEGVLREGSQGGAMDVGAMREGFDPSNAESVRQMQRMLNQAGFTGADGNPLSEDGKFGPQSLAALRKMQGGHRQDNASVSELSAGDSSYGNVNDRGKEHLYSDEGRGKSTSGETQMVGNYAGTGGISHTPPEFSMNTKQRQDAVGNVRGGAKGIDDYIEGAAPWLAESSPYRGAKEGVKKFFNWAGDADY